jgi:hypothetical protein
MPQREQGTGGDDPVGLERQSITAITRSCRRRERGRVVGQDVVRLTAPVEAIDEGAGARKRAGAVHQHIGRVQQQDARALDQGLDGGLGNGRRVRPS